MPRAGHTHRCIRSRALVTATLLVAALQAQSLRPYHPGAPFYKRGDANADGGFDIGDAIYTLGFLFGRTAEIGCDAAADANADGRLDIGDPIFLLTHLFGGGAPPAFPGRVCASTPSAKLGCGEYRPCRQLEGVELVGNFAFDIGAIEFLPDGERVLVGGERGAAVINVRTGVWEASMGELFVGSNRVAPAPDGSSALVQGQLYWDLATYRIPISAGAPDGLACYHQGRPGVLSSALDMAIELWDVETGACLRRFETRDIGEPLAVASDGTRFLAFLHDAAGTWVGLYDLADGRAVLRTHFERNLFGRCAVSGDGNRIAVDLGDATIAWADIAAGGEWRLIASSSRAGAAVALSADGSLLALAATGLGGSTQVWDLAAGEVIMERPRSGSPLAVGATTEHRDLVVKNAGSCLTHVDLDTGSEKCLAPAGLPARLAFGADGRSVLVSTGVNSMRWDFPEIRFDRTLGHEGAATHLIVATADDRYLACAIGSGHSDAVVHIEAAASRAVVCALPRAFAGGVGDLAFSPDGSMLLVGDATGALELFSASAGTLLRSFTDPETALRTVADVEFSSSGRLILTAGYDGYARLWETSSGTLLRRFEHGAYAAKLSPDERLVLAAGSSVVVIYDAATGERRFAAELPTDPRRTCGAFSPDGRLFAHSLGYQIFIRDTATGAERQRMAWTAPYELCFSPDGAYLLTTQDSVRVWRVARE
jgi:WD40 repeat protein